MAHVRFSQSFQEELLVPWSRGMRKALSYVSHSFSFHFGLLLFNANPWHAMLFLINYDPTIHNSIDVSLHPRGELPFTVLNRLWTELVIWKGSSERAFSFLCYSTFQQWGCTCWLKKNAQAKSWELCFIHRANLRAQAQGHSISDNAEKTVPKRQGVGEPGCIGVFVFLFFLFATKDQVEHQKITVNKRKPDISG